MRTSQFRELGTKLLNVGNILKDGRLDLGKTKFVSLDETNGRYKHFLCDVGDLVIASSGISIEQDGWLSTRGAFVRNDHLPLCMNTSTIRFKAKGNRGSLTFLREWLGSQEFRRQITRLVTGSAQLNFGPTHLKQLQISLPAPSEQKKIERKLEFVDNLIDKVLTASRLSDQLFSSLQSRAFSGQL